MGCRGLDTGRQEHWIKFGVQKIKSPTVMVILVVVFLGAVCFYPRPLSIYLPERSSISMVGVMTTSHLTKEHPVPFWRTETLVSDQEFIGQIVEQLGNIRVRPRLLSLIDNSIPAYMIPPEGLESLAIHMHIGVPVPTRIESVYIYPESSLSIGNKELIAVNGNQTASFLEKYLHFSGIGTTRIID